MKKLILFLFIFSTTFGFSEVDEVCLCNPNELYIALSEPIIMAVDSCDFNDSRVEILNCKSYNFIENLSNNFDSSYIYVKRNVVIYYDKYIFKDGFTKGDTLKNIDDISDQYSSFKEFYIKAEAEFEAIKLYNVTPDPKVIIEFDEFKSLSRINNFVESNWELLKKIGLDAYVYTYEALLASVDISEKNSINLWTYQDTTKEILIYSPKVRKIEIYNLLGEKVISREVNYSSLINLTGKDRMLFVVTYDSNNNIHTKKIINN